MDGPNQDTTFADDGNTLARDISCVGCGYNLRGLSRTGVCPECGKPISETLKRVSPEELPDLADELSTLSWTYLGMSVLLLLCAVPIGMQVGWAGMIVVTALAGYRLATLWRIDRVLKLRQNVHAIAVQWLFVLTAAELGSGVILLGVLSFSTPGAGGFGLAGALMIVAGAIWIIALLAGLAAAGRVTQMLRRHLGIDGSASLLQTQFALAVIAPWMLIVGVSIEVAGITGNLIGATGVLSFVVAALCMLASSVLLFLALQHLAQSLHEALIDERASHNRAHRIALPGRGVIEVDPDGRVQGGSTSAEPEGRDNEPPPIPLVGEEGYEVHPSKPGGADPPWRAARDSPPGPDTDDPMAHIEERL